MNSTDESISFTVIIVPDAGRTKISTDSFFSVLPSEGRRLQRLRPKGRRYYAHNGEQLQRRLGFRPGKRVLEAARELQAAPLQLVDVPPGDLTSHGSQALGASWGVSPTGWKPDYRGFLPKSPAGLTVVAGVFVGAADAGLWEAAGDGVAAGRFALSFVITDSLKS